MQIYCLESLSHKRLLGNTDIFVSPISFGCWGISSPEWGTTMELANIRRILDAAWDVGINFFDTAPVYGDGIGEMMFASIPWKYEAILATKVSAKQKPSPPIATMRNYYRAGHVTRSVENSLRRMRRQYIDVVQIHNWYDVWEGEADYVFKEFQTLKQQGKLRAIGISLPEWSSADIGNLLAKNIVDVIQVPINLFQQWAMERVVKPAYLHNIGILARSPLDHGLLTLLSTKLETLPDNDFRKKKLMGERIQELNVQIQRVCNLTGINQKQLPYYAIAYCLAHVGITSTIVGMRKLKHVRENTKSSNYKFSADQLEKGKFFNWERGW